jgi:hypothetical protein
MRHPLIAAGSALTALAVAALSTPALAAGNQQSGLVNVNVQDVTAQAPVAVSVPVGVAANVCNVDAAVLAEQAGTGSATCTAVTDSAALNQAIAQSVTTGGGGSSNRQSGLVNVNIQGLTVQVPVSVAVPVGIAADVCNVDAAVLAQQANAGAATCIAHTTSTALQQAIARNLA